MADNQEPTQHQKDFYTAQRKSLEDQAFHHYNRDAAGSLASLYQKLQPTATGVRADSISHALPYLQDAAKSGYGMAEFNDRLGHPLMNALMEALPMGKMAGLGKAAGSIPKAAAGLGNITKQLIPHVGEEAANAIGQIIDHFKGFSGNVSRGTKVANNVAKEAKATKAVKMPKMKADTSSARKTAKFVGEETRPMKSKVRATDKLESKGVTKGETREYKAKTESKSAKNPVKNKKPVEKKSASDLPKLKSADKVKGVRESGSVRNKSKKGTDGRKSSRKSKG